MYVFGNKSIAPIVGSVFCLVLVSAQSASARQCTFNPVPVKTINRCATARAHGGEVSSDRAAINGKDFSIINAPQTYQQLYVYECTESCGLKSTFVADVQWDCVAPQEVAGISIDQPADPTREVICDDRESLDGISNQFNLFLKQSQKPAGMPAPVSGINYWQDDSKPSPQSAKDSSLEGAYVGNLASSTGDTTQARLVIIPTTVLQVPTVAGSLSICAQEDVPCFTDANLKNVTDNKITVATFETASYDSATKILKIAMKPVVVGEPRGGGKDDPSIYFEGTADGTSFVGKYWSASNSKSFDITLKKQ